MAQRPIVALGLGAAGCQLVNTLTIVANEINKTDAVSCIALDANSDDLNRLSPDDATRVALKRPSAERWEVEREQYEYLTATDQVSDSPGTMRQRGLGRYYIESNGNLEAVHTAIKDVFETVHVTDEGGMDIWLMTALSGGTGSGASPLVAALVRQIADRLAIPVRLFGIGTVPRLDRPEKNGLRPAGHPTLYANSYTALRELRHLQGRTDDPTAEHTFSLERGTADSDELTVDVPLFDEYWLIGYDEAKTTAAYRRQLNRIVANGIFFRTTQPIPSNPSSASTMDGSFYALTGGEFRLPMESVEQLSANQQSIAEMDMAIDRLHSEIESLTDMDDYLRQIRRLDTLQTTDSKGPVSNGPPADLPVVNAAVDAIDGLKPLSLWLDHVTDTPQPAQSFSFWYSETTYDNHLAMGSVVEELVSETLAENQPTLREPSTLDDDSPVFDQLAVMMYCYCTILGTHLDRVLAEHWFHSHVDELWSVYSSGLPEATREALANASPVEKWREGLRDTLYHIIINRLRETTKSPIDWWLNGKELAELASAIHRCEMVFEDYRVLTALREAARTRRDQARQSLRTASDSVTDAIDRKRDQIDRYRAQRQQTIKEIERLTAKLTDGDQRFGCIEPPLRQLDAVSPEVFSNPTISGLVESGYLDEPTVRNGVATLLGRPEVITDPVQDRVEETDSNATPQPGIGILAHPDDREYLPSDRPKRTPSDDYTPIDDRLPSFDAVDSISVADGTSIRVCSWFGPINLELTSEFATLDKYYRSETHALSEQFGPSISDEVVSSAFAYPELISAETTGR